MSKPVERKKEENTRKKAELNALSRCARGSPRDLPSVIKIYSIAVPPRVKIENSIPRHRKIHLKNCQLSQNDIYIYVYMYLFSFFTAPRIVLFPLLYRFSLFFFVSFFIRINFYYTLVSLLPCRWGGTILCHVYSEYITWSPSARNRDFPSK